MKRPVNYDGEKKAMLWPSEAKPSILKLGFLLFLRCTLVSSTTDGRQ
jgi:hypothetical protein